MGPLYWKLAVLVAGKNKTMKRSKAARRCAASLCAALTAVSGLAQALDGDRIRPSVGATYTYTSNLFYVDDRIPPQSLSFLKDGQKSDQIYGLKVGLDADIPVSRQMLTLRASATNNNYVTYDNLNYVGYNVRGAWNWVVGSDWDGDAGFGRVQALGSFADVRTNVRNIRNTDELFASAMYRVVPDWKLRVAVRNTKLENSADTFKSTDRDDTTYELGSRRYSKGGDNFIGVNLRAIDGRFPNRVVTPTATVDNSYRQYTLEGVVDWIYSGQSKLSGTLGWTNRIQDQLSERNFSGITGRLTAIYSPTGIIGLNAAIFREIGSYEDITTSYILTQGFRFGPSYAVSEKLMLRADYTFSNRQYLGDPGFVVTGLPVRDDDINSISGSAIWSPRRNVQVNATLSYDTRVSNRPLTDYNVTTFFVSAMLTF